MDNQISKPEFQNNHIIRVIGVGGGGSNAVNYMFNQDISGVDFMVCNTDLQALNASLVPYKIQIGVELTKGLGAGAKPDAGKKAALENEAELRAALEGAEMIFITAGMGGGTGTGAAPVIAAIAKEMNILTVGIVTRPFSFEGKPKKVRAEKGIDELKKNCDTVIEILNDRLKDFYGNLSMREAFGKADVILAQSALSISDSINEVGIVNIDFEDVKTAVSNAGSAVMGIGIASGDGRAIKAVDEALISPLLNNTSIKNSKYILLVIKVNDIDSIQMEELEEMTDHLQERSGSDTEVIWGAICQESLGDNISVTIIATGFEEQAPQDTRPAHKESKKKADPKVVVKNIDDVDIDPDPKPVEAEDDLLSDNSWDKIDPTITDDKDFKEKQEVPAYKRRGINLGK